MGTTTFPARKEYKLRKLTGRRAYASPAFFPAGFPLPVKLLWMNGKTPPPAMVARTSVSSSSSPRIASCRWRGVIRFTRRSLDAFPFFK